MSQEILLEKLKLSISIEQKAALVAESIIQDLPSHAGKVAIWCGLLPWFSNELIEDMLGAACDDATVQKIVNLPFVEKISSGYCFHATTRKGLLIKYRAENPLEIQKAFEAAQKILESNSDPEAQHLIYILYGYIITNQGLKAEELLLSMLMEGKIKEFDSLVLSRFYSSYRRKSRCCQSMCRQGFGFRQKILSCIFDSKHSSSQIGQF
jgi:hypothetical protein